MRSKRRCARTSAPPNGCCWSSPPASRSCRSSTAATCASLRAGRDRAEDVRDAVRIRPAALRPDSRQPARLPVRRRHDRDRLGRARAARAAQASAAACSRSAAPTRERFHPTMSTEFLARIGDLVSEAIADASRDSRAAQPMDDCSARAGCPRFLTHLSVERRLSPHTDIELSPRSAALRRYCDQQRRRATGRASIASTCACSRPRNFAAARRRARFSDG